MCNIPTLLSCKQDVWDTHSKCTVHMYNIPTLLFCEQGNWDTHSEYTVYWYLKYPHEFMHASDIVVSTYVNNRVRYSCEIIIENNYYK